MPKYDQIRVILICPSGTLENITQTTLLMLWFLILTFNFIPMFLSIVKKKVSNLTIHLEKSTVLFRVFDYSEDFFFTVYNCKYKT